jgi:hypothetical protein
VLDTDSFSSTAWFDTGDSLGVDDTIGGSGAAFLPDQNAEKDGNLLGGVGLRSGNGSIGGIVTLPSAVAGRGGASWRKTERYD